jgi:NAD(P)-dependent dehydrogenase (short-subunit alcohol dehydrogenase family)
VTNGEQVRAAVAEAVRQGPFRIVVSCAGIAPSARILGGSGVHDLGLYAKVIQINLVGTFTVMALAAEAIAQTEPLEHGQRGVIINTASIAAFDGQIGQAAAGGAGSRPVRPARDSDH